MHTLTFYPIGNADCYRVVLANGKQLLFDYADRRVATDTEDRRIDLPKSLWEALKAAGKNHFDVVAFTHSDKDHVQGAAAFFHLLHDEAYQGDDRIKITELWVPAKLITEDPADLCEDAQILQSEAWYRLRHQSGIRVFSQPEALAAWLDEEGLTLELCNDCLSGAGQLVPGFTKADDGIEFFVHSPFAIRQDDGTLDERNDCSLVLQATFTVLDVETRFLLGADVTHEVLAEIVDVTKWHKNQDRLKWDVLKVPHHSSYLSLNSERGEDTTIPVPNVKWVFEDQAGDHAIIVSTSKPIPATDPETDTDPPHRQAANYYRACAERADGEYVVTMEHPKESQPEPLVITIGSGGATREKRISRGTIAAVSRPSPRMG